MHKYVMYACDKCNYESKSYDEMNEHEAAHLGLTVKEMETYKSLKSIVQHLGHVISNKNNDVTRRQYDLEVEKLISFEKFHGII